MEIAQAELPAELAFPIDPPGHMQPVITLERNQEFLLSQRPVPCKSWLAQAWRRRVTREDENMKRRAVLVTIATVALFGPSAHADPYPTRPVTIVVGFAAGSGI